MRNYCYSNHNNRVWWLLAPQDILSLYLRYHARHGFPNFSIEGMRAPSRLIQPQSLRLYVSGKNINLDYFYDWYVNTLRLIWNDIFNVPNPDFSWFRSRFRRHVYSPPLIDKFNFIDLPQCYLRRAFLG